MYAESEKGMERKVNRNTHLRNTLEIPRLTHRDRCAAYTLIEIVLVLLILSLVATLVLPAVASRLGQLDEQRRLARMVSEVRNLRDQAFSLRVPARVVVSGAHFVLFLDGEEKCRFPLKTASVPGGEIRLNRFGVTAGGSLNVVIKRRWILKLEPGPGGVSLEKAAP